MCLRVHLPRHLPSRLFPFTPVVLRLRLFPFRLRITGQRLAADPRPPAESKSLTPQQPTCHRLPWRCSTPPWMPSSPSWRNTSLQRRGANMLRLTQCGMADEVPRGARPVVGKWEGYATQLKALKGIVREVVDTHEHQRDGLLVLGRAGWNVADVLVQVEEDEDGDEQVRVT